MRPAPAIAITTAILVLQGLALQSRPPQTGRPKASSTPQAPQALKPPEPSRIHISDGEELYYSATWRLWRAGYASLKLARQDSEEQITFAADSTGIISVLYPVHDRIESRYTPDTFCATQVIKDTAEGRRKRHTSIVYDTENRQIVLDEQNLDKPKSVSKHETKPIPGCVLDMFSALYYVRTLPLKIGEVYNFPVNEGGNTIEVQLTADLEETITTPVGAFKAIRTVPAVFDDKLFHRSGKMWLWFSDDNRRLPLMLKAKVSWGTVTAVLNKVVEPGQASSGE